jgi:cytochrome c oxidase subunit 2
VKRDLILAGVLWLVLTAIGEYLVLTIDIHPLTKSDKGADIEDAFRILLVMAMPVFTMVVAVLVYTVLRHRASGSGVPEDGPAITGQGAVPVAWFAITAALTMVVMVFPGLTSLSKVIEDPAPELVVDVKGAQWTWLIDYPQEGLQNQRELVLPVDRTVRFNVTSLDVLHSFWVPAFAMKIDAVPGKTTGFTLRPTETGSFRDDPLMRVQCAELCGLSHGRMTIPVRVISQQEFQQWLNEVKATPTPAPAGAEAQTVEISAQNTAFDKAEIRVKAGGLVTVKVSNKETVPHNWALYESESAALSGAKAIAATQLKAGPYEEQATFEAPKPGTYFFRCDAHPQQMRGTLVVE